MGVREMFHVKHWPAPGQARAAAGALLLAAALAGTAPLAAQDDKSAPPPPPPPGTVIFKDNEARTVAGSEVSRDFSYSWPAEVTAVPALVRRFTAERAEMLTEQKIEFAAGLSMAEPDGCFGCNHDLVRDWAVSAETPRFLVLRGSNYVYSGGAHGNIAFDGLVWDRKAEKAIYSSWMFASERALQTALGAPWCAALKAERADRLGEEASAVIEDDGIFPCPPIADLVVLPASTDGQRFDRIGLIAAPYVAGSYAEGVYEVTLPVTPAVLAAVKPRYRTAFVAAK